MNLTKQALTLSRKRPAYQVPGFRQRDGVLGLSLEVAGRLIGTWWSYPVFERFCDSAAIMERAFCGGSREHS